MKPASCKQKGRRLQDLVTTWIRSLFNLSPADVKPAIMGESGIDIKLSEAARKVYPYAVECKNQESLNLFKCWKQTVENAQKEGLTPMLFVKKNGTDVLMVMNALHGMTILEENAILKGLVEVES